MYVYKYINRFLVVIQNAWVIKFLGNSLYIL